MSKKYFDYYKSPIGILEITSDEDSILSVIFVDEEKQDIEFNKVPRILKKAYVQLDEYFKGKRNKFDLKISFTGTDFQKKVWNELTNISYGEVVSYKYIAEKIGNEKAVRAIGNANSKNPISIIVPCHRVIGANGSLTGYAGGIERKEWLLNHEKTFVSK
ncbi:O-6-methylguanine DNA methyltransferase [Gottschalkia purinilytica]|uniref:Methylated-DNA--protein-cysteine methyltransferase n=1 Tax=Gottschalkia purinilytica TaxID=1503 RepID=A0A0L0WCN5_GOTPU|nr:methylated-DNA--[protein]-cysteine S-methyltransferase [Gottschalkia purinilytica]KNF09221.1 O-6-methylguanine DNA methyltransferase [Gottschalkia purinilytica]